MAAPGSEKLDENILGGVVDDSVVVLGGELDYRCGAGKSQKGDNNELEHFPEKDER